MTADQEHLDDGEPFSHASFPVYDREAGTAYIRQWAVPVSEADGFAEMMTARFGEPGDGIVRIADLQKAAETAVIIDSGGPAARPG